MQINPKTQSILNLNTDYLPDSLKPYTAESSGKWATLVGFDCRGLEPVEFDHKCKGWLTVGTESGTPFKEITLEDGDWADYDEPASQSVGIYEMESQFIRIK